MILQFHYLSLILFYCWIFTQLEKHQFMGLLRTWLLEKKINSKREKKLVTKDNLFKAIIAEDNPILITMGAGDIEVEVDKFNKKLIVWLNISIT